jgi:hypothetical protein
VLAALGLEDVADRRTAGFSQGERMKTALGRAMLHAPRNLILDEPTNGLDVPTVRSLRGLLRIWRDAGACVVFSSHVLEEVRALCDQVANRGRCPGDGRYWRRCHRSGGTRAAAGYAIAGGGHLVVHRRRVGIPDRDRLRLWICRSDGAALNCGRARSAADSLCASWRSAWDGSTGAPRRAYRCRRGYSDRRSTDWCGCFRWCFSFFWLGTGGRNERSWRGWRV